MEYKVIRSEDYLAHHGILGQKWGVRRYQNEDGSLTPEGEKRYAKQEKRADRRIKRNIRAKNINRKIAEIRNDTAENIFGEKLTKNYRNRNNALVDMLDERLDYRIAKQKAKKDPNYKFTKEYDELKTKAGKAYVDQFVLGSYGAANMRAKALAKGKDLDAARKKTYAIMAGLYIGTYAGSMIVSSKMMDAARKQFG